MKLTIIGEIYPWLKLTMVNTFVPNTTIPMQFVPTLTVFRCFQGGVEKGCIENEWVNIYGIFTKFTGERNCPF